MTSANSPRDAVDIALDMGMGRVTATMVQPYMWFTPATVDPLSPAIVLMVRSLQKRLRALGYQTRGDGYVDQGTIAALRQVAGADWKSRPFVQIFSDVLAASSGAPRPRAMRQVPYSLSGLGDVIGPALPKEWTTKAGVCYPQTPRAVKWFGNLQRNLNRVLAVNHPDKLLGVDNRIGQKTVAATNLVLGTKYTKCDQVAAKVDALGDQAWGIANRLNQPLEVPSPPPPQPPSTVAASGEVVNPPVPLGDQIRDLLGKPIGMAAVGLTVFGGIYAYNRTQGRR